MMKIDPARSDLAREFRDKPMGPHSPELRRVLLILREGSIRGKTTIARLGEGEGYCLAEVGRRRGDPIVYHRDRTFARLKDAMWALFQARWEQATGSRPAVD
jgi:hypothetical protein